jgi:hypothetical protein
MVVDRLRAYCNLGQVWDVLTAYEQLPTFVPNLMLCERLPVPFEYAGRVVRLRQVRTHLRIMHQYPF